MTCQRLKRRWRLQRRVPLVLPRPVRCIDASASAPPVIDFSLTWSAPAIHRSRRVGRSTPGACFRGAPAQPPLSRLRDGSPDQRWQNAAAGRSRFTHASSQRRRGERQSTICSALRATIFISCHCVSTRVLLVNDDRNASALRSDIGGVGSRQHVRAPAAPLTARDRLREARGK